MSLHAGADSDNNLTYKILLVSSDSSDSLSLVLLLVERNQGVTVHKRSTSTAVTFLGNRAVYKGIKTWRHVGK